MVDQTAQTLLEAGFLPGGGFNGVVVQGYYVTLETYVPDRTLVSIWKPLKPIQYSFQPVSGSGL